MPKSKHATGAPEKSAGVFLFENGECIRIRTCRKCDFHGTETLFKKGGGKGQHSNTCKACDRARPRRRYAENRDAMLAADRQRHRANCELKRERARAYKLAHPDLVRAQNLQAVRRYAEAHPERRKARLAVKVALEAGRISRPDVCQAKGCSVSLGLHAHHRSCQERNWLDVDWLCKNCHERCHHASSLERQRRRVSVARARVKYRSTFVTPLAAFGRMI